MEAIESIVRITDESIVKEGILWSSVGISKSRTTFTACHREVSILNSGHNGENQLKLWTPNSHNKLSKMDSNDFHLQA